MEVIHNGVCIAAAMFHRNLEIRLFRDKLANTYIVSSTDLRVEINGQQIFKYNFSN